MKNIYLTGFMGAGKTKIGKTLQATLKCPFADLDFYIERVENKPIPEIFADHGEAYFREIEKKSLVNVVEQPRPRIISLGGGTLNSPENVEICKETGVILYLEISFDTAYERIRYSSRPIVKRSTVEELEAIFNTRRKIYESVCDIRVNAEGTPFEIARTAKNLLKMKKS
jgi:shikimate kinase